LGWINNIDIIIDGKYHAEYLSAESLGIKFARRVDDFNDLSKRFGDFSYTFNIPITKNNSQIFNFANAHGKSNVFLNQSFPCQVYNNNKLLIDGTIELVGVDLQNMVFNVCLHSKISEFIDDITGKNLTDLKFPTMVFQFEKTIVDWTNANYKNSDEALLQFPLVFYNTFYCPFSVYSGLTTMEGNIFVQNGDNTFQNMEYLLNTTPSPHTKNMMFYHQFPPAVYMVRIMQQIFADAGWTLGGSFWQNEDIKKIVCLYVGETDVYDRAGVSGHTSGFTSPDKVLNPALFMPANVKQIDFVKGVINAFNLYFNIDVQNKIVNFETWYTMFSTRNNPLDLTNFIKRDTMLLQKADNANPSITFKASGNQYILGDNKVMKNYSVDINAINYVSGNPGQLNYVFNKVGAASDINVDILFGEPQTHRMFIYQDLAINNATGCGMSQIFLPMISKQTPTDNGSHPFNTDTGNTESFNTESTIQYAGDMSMYYYLGQSTSDTVKGGATLEDLFYVNVPTGFSATIQKMKFGYCTPWMINTNRVNIQAFFNSLTPQNLATQIRSRDIVTCSYLQGAYDMLVRADNNIIQTGFSLCFDDDNTYHETLYTKFHQAKYSRYQNNNLLVADCILTDDLWNQLQINVPVLYYNEIYHLVQIDSYDPINNICNITLIKDM
jgi:hypothetical protein